MMQSFDIKEFSEKYYKSLRDLLDVIPKGKTIPPCLTNTSFLIGYSDVRGKIGIQLLSREKVPKIILNDRTLEPTSKTQPFGIVFKDVATVEDAIFPQDESDGSVSLSIAARNVTVSGLAFSSKKYHDKYWKDVTFYRNTAGTIPFSVTPAGTMLGIDLLWGSELGGNREEKLFEYIKLFGSNSLTPSTDEELRNETFRDFGHLVGKLGDEALKDWSFTDFVKSLQVPTEQNILLLGSYSSDNDFTEIQNVLDELGFRAFLLKDSPDLPVQSNIEKLFTAIICSCFVIVLDNQPSGHIAELESMLQFPFRPVIVLRTSPKPSTSFLEDRIRTSENFKVAIEHQITVGTLLPHLIWAKARVKSTIESFNEINIWRNKQ